LQRNGKRGNKDINFKKSSFAAQRVFLKLISSYSSFSFRVCLAKKIIPFGSSFFEEKKNEKSKKKK
jgi:hypothetical protein